LVVCLAVWSLPSQWLLQLLIIACGLTAGIVQFREDRKQPRKRPFRVPRRTWWDEPPAETDGPPEVAAGFVTFGTAAIGVALVAAFILLSIGRD
jgi:hypothetical protein